jgi:hypothetical protein
MVKNKDKKFVRITKISVQKYQKSKINKLYPSLLLWQLKQDLINF